MSSEGIFVPLKYSHKWDENTITHHNMIQIDYLEMLAFSINYDLMSYSMNINIDITEWVNTGIDIISIVFPLGMGIDDYYEGYSREHSNQDLVPKIIWTI